jgi:outer membrane protein assembly factor BamB
MNKFNKNRNLLIAVSFITVVFFSGTVLLADDWQQWRGPERNGSSKETNLLKNWPENGPDLLWSVENMGEGFSSASISNGQIYITGVIDKQETLTSLDPDGQIKWQTTYGDRWKGSYPEARTTPTLDGNLVYVISGMGKVICVDAKSGQIKWSVQALDDFDGEYPKWGIAESPLIIDNKIICTPGGEEASVVALDKITGKMIWQSLQLSELGNYCSPILINRGGKKIIATQLAESFVGLDAEDGTLLWRDEYEDYQDDPKDININSPLYHDGHIFVTSGYDNPSASYELSPDGTKITRKWINEILDVHLGGVVLVNGYIYGSNWENNKNGNWVCLDWKTGKVMWEEKWITKGSIITAEGMLYCYEEKEGTFGLVSATPEKFDMVSSFRMPPGKGRYWAHPAISDSRLYVRHGDALMVYDISQ